MGWIYVPDELCQAQALPFPIHPAEKIQLIQKTHGFTLRQAESHHIQREHVGHPQYVKLACRLH
jgi:hypothetical protein